jgi:hypothetical protein
MNDWIYDYEVDNGIEPTVEQFRERSLMVPLNRPKPSIISGVIP